jgi:hypothetical protein
MASSKIMAVCATKAVNAGRNRISGDASYQGDYASKIVASRARFWIWYLGVKAYQYRLRFTYFRNYLRLLRIKYILFVLKLPDKPSSIFFNCFGGKHPDLH